MPMRKPLAAPLRTPTGAPHYQPRSPPDPARKPLSNIDLSSPRLSPPSNLDRRLAKPTSAHLARPNPLPPMPIPQSARQHIGRPQRQPLTPAAAGNI